MNDRNRKQKYLASLLCLFSILVLTPQSVFAGNAVRVGVYDNSPLTRIDENGTVSGVFIDILEYIAEKENWDIQYVPSSVYLPEGELQRDPMKWIPLYRKILEAGKKAYIFCPPERVKPVLNALPREGVFLWIFGNCDEKTARRTLVELDRIGM